MVKWIGMMLSGLLLLAWGEGALAGRPTEPATAGGASSDPAKGADPKVTRPLEAWEVQVLNQLELLENLDMLERMELLEELPMLRGAGGAR